MPTYFFYANRFCKPKILPIEYISMVFRRWLFFFFVKNKIFQNEDYEAFKCTKHTKSLTLHWWTKVLSFVELTIKWKKKIKNSLCNEISVVIFIILEPGAGHFGINLTMQKVRFIQVLFVHVTLAHDQQNCRWIFSLIWWQAQIANIRI